MPSKPHLVGRLVFFRFSLSAQVGGLARNVPARSAASVGWDQVRCGLVPR